MRILLEEAGCFLVKRLWPNDCLESVNTFLRCHGEGFFAGVARRDRIAAASRVLQADLRRLTDSDRLPVYDPVTERRDQHAVRGLVFESDLLFQLDRLHTAYARNKVGWVMEEQVATPLTIAHAWATTEWIEAGKPILQVDGLYDLVAARERLILDWIGAGEAPRRTVDGRTISSDESPGAVFVALADVHRMVSTNRMYWPGPPATPRHQQLDDGSYFIADAVASLAAQLGFSAEQRADLARSMGIAARKPVGSRRHLTTRSPLTGLPIVDGESSTLLCAVLPADVNDWLKASDVAYRWEVTSDVATSTPISSAADVPSREVSAEDPTERRRRRLERFTALGAWMQSAGDGWHTRGTRGALAKLVREEAAAERPMHDKKDVRNDLIEATKRRLVE